MCEFEEENNIDLTNPFLLFDLYGGVSIIPFMYIVIILND